ncbi:putative flavonoid 3',5'-hydroxylase [Lupinus albus]|uniref:Putative flavonoid 3',5'-hydroxylase n=1 Tax=Lupinus albus TaxID=3870 RepID=A0A6A4PPT1_LUPAL|nr:putative flavonoid 3',5'-hydroxylase [Lupinus albus]
MAGRSFFTLSQVAQHNSKQDCWLVINGKVSEVTKFLEEHPGGEEALLELAGKDATKEFDAIGHSMVALNMLLKYQVGVVQGAIVEEVDPKDVMEKESKSKDMSAFVIKEDAMPLAFYELFVPLIVATLYFVYRCLTTTYPLTTNSSHL